MASSKLPKIFEPLAPIPELNYVYRFYDARDRLLYVGITRNPQNRFNAHQNSPWWDTAERCTIEPQSTRARAFWAEAMAIHEESPIYNATATGVAGREQLRARAEGRPLAPEFAVYYPEFYALIQAHLRADELEKELLAVRAELAALKEERVQNRDPQAIIDGLRRQLTACAEGGQNVAARAERAERAARDARRQWVVSDGQAALAAVLKQPVQRIRKKQPVKRG